MDKLGERSLRFDSRLSGPRNAVGHVYINSDADELIEYTAEQRDDPFSVPDEQHHAASITQGIKDGGLAQSIVAEPPSGGWKSDRYYLGGFLLNHCRRPARGISHSSHVLWGGAGHHGQHC